MVTDTEIADVQIDPSGCKGPLGVPVSARNNQVAAALRQAGLATLLLDRLTPYEEADRRNVFNIDLLASPLVEAARWIGGRPETRHLIRGYFGAGTSAGAALSEAAMPVSTVAAMVSRNGRSEGINERAQAAPCGKKRLISNKGRPFVPRTGTMDEVVKYATYWFLSLLDRPAAEN